eukprot:14853860-Heterocapsa_arctica.AAC.1
MHRHGSLGLPQMDPESPSRHHHRSFRSERGSWYPVPSATVSQAVGHGRTCKPLPLEPGI